MTAPHAAQTRMGASAAPGPDICPHMLAFFTASLASGPGRQLSTLFQPAVLAPKQPAQWVRERSGRWS